MRGGSSEPERRWTRLAKVPRRFGSRPRGRDARPQETQAVASPKRPARRALIFGAALALTLIAIPVAAASASNMWGVYFRYPTTDPQDPGLMQAAHVKTARFPVKWYEVQANPGDPFDWNSAGYNQRIGTLACKGITSLPTLQAPPPFAANDVDTPPVDTQQHRDEWNAFVSAAVHQYGPNGAFWSGPFQSMCPGHAAVPIKWWQIWNEPNLPRFNHSSNPVGDFATLVTISHQTIRSIDPTGNVLLGGIPDGPAFHFWTFINQLYQVPGIENNFEALDAHPYSPTIAEVRDRMNRYRHVMNHNGDKHTPIFIGEFGWGSGPRDSSVNRGLKGQAKNLTRSFRLFVDNKKKWRLKRVIWYEWRDPTSSPPGQGCPFCATSGLLKSDFSKKPSYRAYKRFAAHH